LKKSITLFAVCALIACTAPNSQEPNNRLEEFNAFLGMERAEVLDATVASFQDFLVANYPDYYDEGERTLDFLKELNKILNDSSRLSLNPKWKFDTERNKILIGEWESTGLRKEVWLYGYEYYEPKHAIATLLTPEGEDSIPAGELPITEPEDYDFAFSEKEMTSISTTDSVARTAYAKMQEHHDYMLSSNPDGDYLYGLAKYASEESFITEFAKAQYLVRGISPGGLIPALIGNATDFSNPFIQRLLTVELYVLIMKMDLERNKK